MATGQDIIAGGAAIRISVDRSPMERQLVETRARLEAWARDNSSAMRITRGTESSLTAGEGKGFLSGGFKGAQIFDTGMKFATAIAAVKVGIKDVEMFAALAQGDMDGMRKAAEALPFGLGEIVKELSGPVDAAAKHVAMWFMGIAGDSYDAAAAARREKDTKAQAAAWNTGIVALKDVDKAIAKASMSEREFARTEVEGMGLAKDQADELIEKKLHLIDLNEQKKAAGEIVAGIKRDKEALEQQEAALARATMSEREFAAYEVSMMGLGRDAAKELLRLKLMTIDATEANTAAEKANRDAIEATKEAERKAEQERRHDEELRFRGEMDLIEKANRVHEETMSPEERFRNRQSELKDLMANNLIDQPEYDKAIRDALAEAARSVPDAVAHTVGVRGSFNAMEAAGLGAGGPADRIAAATEKTAAMTEKIAVLAKDWGVNFN